MQSCHMTILLMENIFKKIFSKEMVGLHALFGVLNKQHQV